MKMQYLTALVLASSPLWAGAQSTATVTGPNLVKNGSFEDYGVTAAQGYKDFYTSGPNRNTTAAQTGWTIASNGLEIRNNNVGTASDGVAFAELDVNRNSSIYQDIATVVGQTYLLTFDYSNRTGSSLSTNGLNWTFGAATAAAPALAVNNTGNNVWSTFSVLVKATSTLTRLTFAASGTSDSLGTSLDKVSVATAAVPEPATTALFLAGLGALGLVSRRRKQA